MVPSAARVAVVVAVGAHAAAGCSSNPSPSNTTAATPTTETSSSTEAGAAPTTSESLAPNAVEVSPGGVTTKVGAPAESTEDDYFQNCRAARTYMDTRGGDPKAQIEPYLKMLQGAPTVGSGEFDKSWTQLSAGQQSAIIVAVESAADALCG
jgi:hypothetical protein